ncbi:MAG: type IV secretory system conjugative DNA transfer family protein, partial [Myxococcales bacterium]|nr:type IV secretory system conjugative DNA transfer family protein [Myxococcales bacterium]
MQDFEKLGAFYLGRACDPQTGKTRDELLLYESKDLTTHAVCVGMTGSGKTGLCVSLLEEAAIDGIPAIAIDLKGDLANLMLTFPELRPADFRPWVDPAEGSRRGLDPEAYAAEVARTWKQGLAEWGQDGSRIARFRDAVETAIYTPGSSAGRPLRVLRSLSAPSAQLAADPDALRDRILATVSGLLSLLGIEADPIRSREHILLSNLVERAWREGRDLELAALIAEIQSPPFDRIGVLDLESFFPSKDRFALAMIFNNLLASPGFAAWMEGEPLDVGRLLHTPEGRPRLSILCLAHLSDPERMFFVTQLLNEVVSWMRTQPGTSS